MDTNSSEVVLASEFHRHSCSITCWVETLPIDVEGRVGGRGNRMNSTRTLTGDQSSPQGDGNRRPIAELRRKGAKMEVYGAKRNSRGHEFNMRPQISIPYNNGRSGHTLPGDFEGRKFERSANSDL